MAAPELEPPLVDVGTGPGVPGLILKLARPEWSVTLLEARRRPANFLRQVVRVLGLSALDIVEDRAETAHLQDGFSGQFRGVTLRAVARVPEAIRLARRLAGPGARIVIGLGPEARARGSGGAIREVEGGPLLGRRRFLILSTPEAEPIPEDVSRGT
jgi:16S rRNA (guanine527-N7)-methyltransferase